MNRDKVVNLAWVLILVPMVLSIFKLIRYAGFREGDHWLLMMGLIIGVMAMMLMIPKLTGKIYDNVVSRNS